MEKHFAENQVPVSFIGPKPDISTPVNIYFHVISKDSTTAGGNVPDSQLASQVQVMNDDYARYVQTFVHQSSMAGS